MSPIFIMRNPYMKFQDSSFNSLKVTVGTKKCDARTQPCRHAPKAICPINFFKVEGMNEGARVVAFSSPEPKACR